MKRLFILTAVTCLLGLTGCEKFLSKVPNNNRTNLDSPEKVSQLLASAYPQGNYMNFAESMSDNVADIGTGSNDDINADSFFFKVVGDDQQDSPEFYWTSCYAAIAAANQALDAIGQAPNPEAYSSQKGEALVARAYSHFMLVTFFAKVYDENAATNLGIPYVTVPEKVVFKQYSRGTVKSVYDMIEKDLNDGLALLSDQAYAVPKYHFTRTATHAFAARFYLFKRDWNKVIEHANIVFPNNNVVPWLRPWNTEYKNTPDYRDLLARYQKATENANILLTETVSFWSRMYTYRYGFETSLKNLILGQNVTGGTWSFNNQLLFGQANHYLLPKINEYFVPVSVNANIGTGYVMVPALTAEEVLFNRAEAYTQLNNTDAAIADLDVYASTRINNYSATTHKITAAKIQTFYNTTDLKQGLIKTILDFKRAEYVQEGMRWFDILRHKLPVVHYSSITGQTLAELTPDDPRRVIQIPSSATLSGVELNPR